LSGVQIPATLLSKIRKKIENNKRKENTILRNIEKSKPLRVIFYWWIRAWVPPSALIKVLNKFKNEHQR
jgi:hypothetical protein